jgi:hypothetical protein
MIVGHKPSGYFLTADGEGKRIEGETRQCVHCEWTWTYAPGSGNRRGFCLHCYGLICGREECFRKQAIIRRDYPDYGCMNWTDYIRREQERFAKEYDYELTPAGILVPRGDHLLPPPSQPLIHLP